MADKLLILRRTNDWRLLTRILVVKREASSEWGRAVEEVREEEEEGGGAGGGGGGGGGSRQEPAGIRELSFVLLFGTPTHGVNTGRMGSD
ncbi:hypothetical protein INR49_029257 [Caranx melampygus]|nr:hypothetical protein INR49_029257 [Caranx melampygus]